MTGMVIGLLVYNVTVTLGILTVLWICYRDATKIDRMVKREITMLRRQYIPAPEPFATATAGLSV